MIERTATATVEQRAQLSLGISDSGIYAAVRRVLEASGTKGGTLLDVGCGEGNLRPFVADLVDRYVGTDIVRYDSFPHDVEFVATNLEGGCVGAEVGLVDVVAAVEVIEHLENPRAFVRELARCVRPGGLVLVTTPNQLSGLSLATLAVKGRHAAFQDVHYPAHLTALLEIDLVRMACEAGLIGAEIHYSNDGRIALTARHFPKALALRFPRMLSDNVLMLARRPRSAASDSENGGLA